jgi:hypothetical protein
MVFQKSTLPVHLRETRLWRINPGRRPAELHERVESLKQAAIWKNKIGCTSQRWRCRVAASGSDARARREPTCC